MRKLLLILSILAPSGTALSGEMNLTFDLGISLIPMTSESRGDRDLRLGTGTELGLSLMKYHYKSGLMDSTPPVRILRLAIGLYGDQPLLILTPLSPPFHENLYLSPSIAIGEETYLTVGINYSLGSID